MSSDAVVWALVGAACAAAAYWATAFLRLLPLERALRGAREEAAENGAFAVEMFEAFRLPATPRALADAVQFSVDRFHARYEGLHLFVWTRRAPIGAFPASSGELLCRTGMLAALRPEDLEIPVEIWKSAFESSERASWRRELPKSLAAAVGSGAAAARFIPWGTTGRLWGMIGVIEESSVPGALERHAPALKVLAAAFSALAARASQFWELNRAREQLEGGLNATMARLDETHLQLVQRAREMNTLEEISEAISEHPDHEGVLRSVVSIIARSLESDLCAVLLLDEGSGELVVQPGAYGVSDDEGVRYRVPLSNRNSSSVRVFRSGKPFVTGDAQADPQTVARYAKMWNCHSLIVVPLTVEGRRIGVMFVGKFKRDFFTPEHLQFVRVIAEEAAVLVEGAVLSKKLAATNVELAKLHSLKDDFVSTVSHEFKTPLTSIKGFLAVLLSEEAGPLNKEQKRFLRITLSAADRLGNLVMDMLDLSRLEGGLRIEMKPISLEAVARRSVENHRFPAEDRQIRLVFESPPLLPKVIGHEEWLRQVFDNLISNAIKFTPQGGQITVGLANRGEGIEARVEDNGIGIPVVDQERIFEKFYRASNRQSIKAPGTGLGLAICQSILDRHEGRIRLESEPGKGSRFVFVVPAARKSAAEQLKQE